MSPKRKNGILEEPTGREKKKQKMTAARTIAVQAVKNTSFSNEIVAGSSATPLVDSLHGLPSAIDVQKFAEARAFEIDAMQNAMKNAATSSTSRAWQSLPRHLRRRAASHDVRRVPLRLREKARAEMDPVRKKALGRSVSKMGKNKRLKRTEIFLKRQRDKLWLETHIWHAKRMKMGNMWDYRLAVHPTEKAFRPSHRASVHGSILHDASYYSLIELKGPEYILKTILEACCDPQGPAPKSKGYTAGSRSMETHIYKPGLYPFGLISPVTIIWKPLVSPSVTVGEALQEIDPSVQKNHSKRRLKADRRENSSVAPAITVDPETLRAVWLRSHPSVFEDIFFSLQTAASLTLEVVKREKQKEGKEYTVEITDLRGQVNAFEIMGPKSNQVLKGALSPVPQSHKGDFTKFWASLVDSQTSGSLGRGMIIGLKVHDPRLNFPPKNPKPRSSSPGHPPPTTNVFPSAMLASSEIWDQATRASIIKPRYRKKDLDERRSKLLVPGTPLNSLRQDDRIPILLIQRSLENPGSDSQALHGWTLIIPAGWSMAFFNSLIFTGTRVGGQRERQTQAFEAGTAYFPRDLPSCAGYETYATARELEEKTSWDRKPPAKRPNFEKLGTKSPWKADWEAILGLPSRSQEAQEGEEELVTTQRKEPDIDKGIQPWLLRGIEVPIILASMSKLLNPGAGLLQEVNRLRAKLGNDPLDLSIKPDQLLRMALVSVRINMCKRGAPTDLAMIYSIEDTEATQWGKVLGYGRMATRIELDSETQEEFELSSIIPPESSIIGYITTGHFSLSQGQGFAIGAVSVIKILELQEQSHRLYSNMSKSPLKLVKVRNVNSQQCRPAFIEILGV